MPYRYFANTCLMSAKWKLPQRPSQGHHLLYFLLTLNKSCYFNAIIIITLITIFMKRYDCYYYLFIMISSSTISIIMFLLLLLFFVISLFCMFLLHHGVLLHVNIKNTELFVYTGFLRLLQTYIIAVSLYFRFKRFLPLILILLCNFFVQL